MSVLIESMTTIPLPDYDIRLWIQEKQLEDFNKIDHNLYKEVITEICSHQYNNLAFLADDILNAFDSLNAVEVKDKKGDGVVLYKDWP